MTVPQYCLHAYIQARSLTGTSPRPGLWWPHQQVDLWRWAQWSWSLYLLGAHWLPLWRPVWTSHWKSNKSLPNMFISYVIWFPSTIYIIFTFCLIAAFIKLPQTYLILPHNWEWNENHGPNAWLSRTDHRNYPTLISPKSTLRIHRVYRKIRIFITIGHLFQRG